MPRTEKRQPSPFRTTLAGALKNVRASIAAFGKDSSRPVTDVIISSNVTLGVDRPADPGVSLWFTWDDGQRCIAVDRYPKAEDNLQAIHHVLEARRTEMRHGGLHIVRQTFKGFLALPAPDAIDWRKELGFRPDEFVTPAAIDVAFRERAEAAHPDKGGSDDAMSRLNAARAAAKAAVNG
jgi:hypothetical protein